MLCKLVTIELCHWMFTVHHVCCCLTDMGGVKIACFLKRKSALIDRMTRSLSSTEAKQEAEHATFDLIMQVTVSEEQCLLG